MQENNKLWLEIKEMFETSQTEVTIFNGAGSDSAKICDMLRVTSASAMGAVILNTSPMPSSNLPELIANIPPTTSVATISICLTLSGEYR